jgi:hypothetical protein
MKTKGDEAGYQTAVETYLSILMNEIPTKRTKKPPIRANNALLIMKSLSSLGKSR